MPSYLTPGVYVEEVETGPQPIQGVSTSVTGAVGVTAQGPTSGKPVLVTSFAEYQATFGGFLPDPPAQVKNKWALDSVDGGQWWQFPLAVKGFFDNGGQQLYVKRVFAGGSGPGQAGATSATAAFYQGLTAAVVQDVDATSNPAIVILSHLIDIVAGKALNFYTPGNPNPLNANPLQVVSYDGSANSVTFNNALGFTLKAGRDIAVIDARTLPNDPQLQQKQTLLFTAKAKGDWGSNLYVRVSPMIGGTFTLLPDPNDPNVGAPFTTQVTQDTDIGQAIKVADVSGFRPVAVFNDHVRIQGQEYKITAIDNGNSTITVQDLLNHPGPSARVSKWSSVTRLRPAFTPPVPPAPPKKSIRVSGASGIYDNAIVQIDNGFQKDTVIVATGGVSGEVVTFTQAIAQSYFEGQKLRIVEAEVDTQNVVDNVVMASEVIQNLKLHDDQTSDFIVTGVGLRSKLVDVKTVPPVPPAGGGGYSETSLAAFPTALDVPWVNLTGGHDNNDQLTVEDFIGTDGGSGMRTGIQALEDITEISICIVPGMWAQAVQSALINHCETLKYRFAILDPPDNLSIQDIISFREPLDTEYAALYYPWVQVLDPSVVRNVDLAPSGHMAGIYALTDTQRGVYKAPANVQIGVISKIAQDVNAREQALLNPIGINALRYFPERGNRVWGARTLSSDTDWKYINVRRLFIYIEASIYYGTQWVVFEPNDQRLWARVRQTITDFLTSTWRDGALQGATPDQAFFVQCDLGTTMTQDDLNNGRLICVVGIAPVRPAEFVIFRIQQIMQPLPAS
jgi:phage tail sheath protein FI